MVIMGSLQCYVTDPWISYGKGEIFTKISTDKLEIMQKREGTHLKCLHT